MNSAYLIEGGSGSGKSTVGRELADQLGAHFVELDWVVARWETPSGTEVERPPDPDPDWLRAHHWRWDLDMLARAVQASPTTTVCAGSAENEEDAFDLFDQVFLLKVDVATQQRRLVDPTRENSFGRSAAVRTLLIDHLLDLQARLSSRGDLIEIDARQPLSTVIAAIRAEIAR